MIKRRDKSGQMQISFGMIFSIILIIAFLGFAFYGIKVFLNTQNEAKAGKFINDLQSDINTIWNSPVSSETREYLTPSGADFVCFIDLSSGAEGDNSAFYQQIRNSGIDYENTNFVFYPVKMGGFGSASIDHINWETTATDENPLCIETANGKVQIMLKKDYGEILVTVAKP